MGVLDFQASTRQPNPHGHPIQITKAIRNLARAHPLSRFGALLRAESRVDFLKKLNVAYKSAQTRRPYKLASSSFFQDHADNVFPT